MQINLKPQSSTLNRRARRAHASRLRKEQKRKLKARLSSPILSAFLALSGLSSTSMADDVRPPSEARIRYNYYTEHQSDGSERMTVNAPMAYVKQQVTDDFSLEGNFTFDSMSGASPFYLDSLSSASINDDRYEGQLRAVQKIDDSQLGATVFLSDEDDYKSLAGSFDYMMPIKGTDAQATFSVSYSSDDVSSTLYTLLGGRRETTSVAAGITQLIDETSVISSSISYTLDNGYLNDPYKSLDNRPRERNAFVWMNRYVQYIEEVDGSIHFDFRAFSDDWGINSQTFELFYYQPFLENWTFRPGFRYYSQHAATFFKNTYPPPPENTGYFSADQRLGTFGSMTTGFMFQRNLGDQWSVDFGADWMTQRTEWSLMGGTGSNYQALHAFFCGIGVAKRFK